MTEIISTSEHVAFFVLALALFFAAWRRHTLSRFPLFYTYLFYISLTGAVALWMYIVQSPSFPLVAWARLLTSSVAEFVVLLEVSDHLFVRFAMVRRLGQFLTAVICTVLTVSYVLPVLAGGHTSQDLILEFFKRASVTKAAIIVALLIACRIYRLPLEREVSGILLGFTVFLAATIVNVTLLERFRAASYGLAFGIIGPVSYTLGMAVWTIALWNAKPALAAQRVSTEGKSVVGLDLQLEKLNTTLARLLRR